MNDNMKDNMNDNMDGAKKGSKRNPKEFQEVVVESLKKIVQEHGKDVTLCDFQKAVKKAKMEIFPDVITKKCKGQPPALNMTVFKKVFCDSPEKDT